MTRYTVHINFIFFLLTKKIYRVIRCGLVIKREDRKMKKEGRRKKSRIRSLLLKIKLTINN